MKYKILLVAFLVSFNVLSQYKGENKIMELKEHELLIEKSLPPLLVASDIAFIDENNNNRIDANESCKIQFKISNQGKGTARNVIASVLNLNSLNTGLIFTDTLDLGNIAPNSFQNYIIPVNGTMELTSGDANFQITFIEKTGLQPDPITIQVTTKAFVNPQIQVVDYSYLSDYSQISLGKPLQLKVLVQNIGQGIGENVKVDFNYPANIVANGEERFELGNLQAGETKEILFDFIATKNYSSPTLSITIDLKEKFGRFTENKVANVAINAKSSGATTVNITSNQQDTRVDIVTASLTSDIDKNIPIIENKNPNKIALIIGNEDYSSRQNGMGSEINVAFAMNDARIVKEYFTKTLGITENNVYFLTNATAGEMKKKINLVAEIIKKMEGAAEFYFYYAGHGFPDEVTKTPYLIPVDVTASNLTDGINLYDMYRKLSEANPKKATIFLDACFSGGGRDAGLLAARAVKIKPKQEIITGNIVVLSATSEEQSALPYKVKQHGMFTYYLLKNLQDSKGNMDYKTLFNSVAKNVSIESLKVNEKAQDPQILFGLGVANYWENWNFME